MPITALAVAAVGTPFNEPATRLWRRIRLTRGEGHSLFERTWSARKCRVAGSPIVGESAPTIDCIWTLIADVSSSITAL